MIRHLPLGCRNLDSRLFALTGQGVDGQKKEYFFHSILFWDEKLLSLKTIWKGENKRKSEAARLEDLE